MRLSAIFDQLTHGELAYLFMGGEDRGGIQICDYPKVVAHINLGMQELYKRFPIKIDDVVIRMHDEIQTYYLDSRFSIHNTESKEPIKYIHDSPSQPFTDNVNKIEFVYDEMGRELFLNNDDEPWSLFTPSYNAIQVPLPEKENQLIVHYRAGWTDIKLPGLNPETEEILIPPGYTEALLMYVGARASTALNADGDAEGNNYTAKFEKSCAMITNLNLMNDDNTRNSKLDKAGWV